MIVLLSILIVALLIYKYVWPREKFWENRAVRACKIRILFSMRALPEKIANAYAKMKREGCRVAGLYLPWEKLLLIIDMELIGSILRTKFEYFNDPDTKNCENSPGFVSLDTFKGESLRNHLQSAFDSLQNPRIVQAVLENIDELIKTLQSDKKLEIQGVLNRYLANVLVTFIFDVEINKTRNSNAEFHQKIHKETSSNVKNIVKSFLVHLCPKLAKKLKLSLSDPSVNEFFIKIVNEALQNPNLSTNNVLGHLKTYQTSFQLSEGSKRLLTTEELAEIIKILFINGMEPTVHALSNILRQIKCNPLIESKLRQEISTVLQRNEYKLTADALHEFVYMDAVIQETLRLHPPVALIRRKCANSFCVDPNVTIETGMICVIPVLAIHRDSEFYSEPNAFNPERFTNNASTTGDDRYLAFGSGPISCLGVNFAMIIMKMTLALILYNFEYEICNPGLLQSKNDLWLKLSPMRTSL